MENSASNMIHGIQCKLKIQFMEYNVCNTIHEKQGIEYNACKIITMQI